MTLIKVDVAWLIAIRDAIDPISVSGAADRNRLTGAVNLINEMLANKPKEGEDAVHDTVKSS